jgi:hypothetical protein
MHLSEGSFIPLPNDLPKAKTLNKYHQIGVGEFSTYAFFGGTQTFKP